MYNFQTIVRIVLVFSVKFKRCDNWLVCLTAFWVSWEATLAHDSVTVLSNLKGSPVSYNNNDSCIIANAVGILWVNVDVYFIEIWKSARLFKLWILICILSTLEFTTTWRLSRNPRSAAIQVANLLIPYVLVLTDVFMCMTLWDNFYNKKLNNGELRALIDFMWLCFITLF